MPKAKHLEASLPVVQVPKALADRLRVEAFDRDAPLSRVIRDRLTRSFEVEGDKIPLTPRDNATQSKLNVEVKLREFELARLQGLFILKEDALDVVIADSHATKQFFEHLPRDLPDEDIEKQRAWLKAEVEKTFANMVEGWQHKMGVKAKELAERKSV